MDTGAAEDKENLFSLSSTYPEKTMMKVTPINEAISASNVNPNKI